MWSRVKVEKDHVLTLRPFDFAQDRQATLLRAQLLSVADEHFAFVNPAVPLAAASALETDPLEGQFVEFAASVERYGVFFLRPQLGIGKFPGCGFDLV